MGITVQFSDSTQATITSFFASPQSPQSYSNLGVVDASDARWKTFYDSLQPFGQIGLPVPTG